jgi:leucyl aminopeptidase
MLNCFADSPQNFIPITPVIAEQFDEWLLTQPDKTQNWLSANNFKAKPESFCLLPDDKGSLARVLVGIKNIDDFWAWGSLSTLLPFNNYCIESVIGIEPLTHIAIAWGLGAYQFTRYKKAAKTNAKLIIPEACDRAYIENIVESIYSVRDLINTPTEDMGPLELADAVAELAKTFNANITQLVGDDLLIKNYPTIHAVGRGSVRSPRLIDLRWGDERAPKLTLVGKGVCFDSGGLDIKPSSGMLLMKKDMAGAAHVLGLARMIMQANLPIRLRVLIPAVENLISGTCYKPGDIITTRKGLTVEIGNTDAEGRLVMCDALAEAVTEKPDLLLDFATLTGAARVAVGTDIAAFFTDNVELAQALMRESQKEQDPLWQLPLHAPYRKMLDSPYADISNASASSYAGAITAALFLKEFVDTEIPWVHFDLMAWNVSSRPGRPEGGEAMGLRAVFGYLRQWLCC